MAVPRETMLANDGEEYRRGDLVETSWGSHGIVLGRRGDKFSVFLSNGTKVFAKPSEIATVPLSVRSHARANFAELLRQDQT